MLSERFKAKARRWALPGAAAALVLAGAAGGISRTFPGDEDNGEKITYSQFMDKSRDHEIKHILIGEDVTTGTDDSGNKYWITKPSSYDKLYGLRGVDIDHEPKSMLGENAALWAAGLGTLALVLLGAQDTIRKMLEASESVRRRKFSAEKTGKTFADIAGIGAILDELKDDAAYLRDGKAHGRFGGHPASGLLFVGGTGSGKSLLAKALAGEADASFIQVSAASLANPLYDPGQQLHALEDAIGKAGRCVVYIDGIEAIARRDGDRNAPSATVLDELLTMMDRLGRGHGVKFVAGTKEEPEALSEELLRSGHFEQTFRLPRPDVEARHEILQLFGRRHKLGADIDLKVVAEEAYDFSGADLESLMNAAALNADRRPGAEAIGRTDFDAAFDAASRDVERPKTMTPEQKWSMALHRAGHVLIMAEKEGEGLHLPRKVSALPEDGELGVREARRYEERVHATRGEIEARVAMLYGGPIAEEVGLGDKKKVSTLGADDLEKASELAVVMANQLGFSKLGLVNYTRAPGASDKLGAQSHAVQRAALEILSDAEKGTREIMEKRKGDLIRLATALNDKETMTADEVRQLLGKSAPTARQAAPRL
jgi:cell division protease FtsH